jgi:hypothetical protein
MANYSARRVIGNRRSMRLFDSREQAAVWVADADAFNIYPIRRRFCCEELVAA